MPVESCTVFMFPLSQHVLEFVHGIEFQNLVEVMRLNSFLRILAISRLEKLIRAANGFFGLISL